MTRLKKELKNRNIIFDEDDYMILMRGAEYDCCQRLVDITETVIITIWYSAVTDPIFKLYDRKTLLPIGGQDVYPMETFSGHRTFCSYAYEEV